MSVGAKLIITLVVLGLVLVAGLTTIYESMVVPAQVDVAADEARMTAIYVQHVSRYLTHEQMQELLERLGKSPAHISRLMILDPKGKVIKSSDPRMIGTQLTDPLILSAAKMGKTIVLTLPPSSGPPGLGQPSMQVLAPEYDARGRRTGEIDVVFSESRLRANLAAYHTTVAIMLLFIALVFAGLAVWVFRYIITPIRRVDEATRRIDQGDLSVRLPVTRRDEIGSLMGHFNSMTGTIASLVSNLRRESAELQEYIDQLVTLTGKLAPDGTVLAANAPVADMTGIRSDELIGVKFWDCPCWDQSDETRNRLKDAVRTAASGSDVRFEDINYGVDGSIHHMDVTLKPIKDEENRVRYIVAEGRDITKRKHAEEALRDSEQRMRALSEATFEGIALSERGVLLCVNEQLAEMLGYRPEEMAGRDIGDFIAPEDRERVLERIRQEREEGFIEYEMERKDGSRLVVEARSRMISYQGRRVRITSIRDITERKQAEEALRGSEQRLRLHVEQTPLGVIGWDTEFRVVGWNLEAERIFGYTAEEAIGRRGSFIVPLSEKETVDRVWNDLITGKGGIRSTNENVTKDSRIILCEWYNTVLTTADGKIIGAASLVQDMTERRRDEEEKRVFYQETIRSATQGRLNLVSYEELDKFKDSAARSAEIRCPENITQVRHKISEFFNTQGLGDERLALFLIGVGEAMANAVKHAGEGTVYAGVEPDCMWVMVSDKGPGIGALTLPKATLRRGFSSKVSMGMGYSIMLEVCDSIWLSTGSEGTTVVLVLDTKAPQLEMSLDDLPDIWSEIPDTSV